MVLEATMNNEKFAAFFPNDGAPDIQAITRTVEKYGVVFDFANMWYLPIGQLSIERR